MAKKGGNRQHRRVNSLCGDWGKTPPAAKQMFNQSMRTKERREAENEIESHLAEASNILDEETDKEF